MPLKRLTRWSPRELSDAAFFSSPELMDYLDSADAMAFDALGFGAIALRKDGSVERYNAAESRASGLRPASVIGKDFFTKVAPCANNEIVAARFRAQDQLDIEIDYLFTFRMIPTKVRLRLLKRIQSPLMYLLVTKP